MIAMRRALRLSGEPDFLATQKPSKKHIFVVFLFASVKSLPQERAAVLIVDFNKNLHTKLLKF